MFFTLNESPRYLVMRGKQDEAIQAITTLRQLPIKHEERAMGHNKAFRMCASFGY